MCQASTNAARTVALFCSSVFLLLLTTWLAPTPAHACGQCYCYGPEMWQAGAGVAKWPRNPRMLVATQPDAELRLRGKRGIVASQTEASGVDGLLWIKPTEPLEAGESYDVEAGVSGDFKPRLHFEVSAELDEQALVVEGVHVAAISDSGICELALGAQLRVDSVRDDAHPGGPVLAEVAVMTGGVEQRVFVPLSAFIQTQQADFGMADLDTTARCLFARAVPHAAADAPATARVRFYDLAGNVTEVAETFEFSFTAMRGGTCGPTGPSTTAGSGAAGHGTTTAGSRASAPKTHAPSGGCSVATDTATDPGAWIGLMMIGGWLRRRVRRV